MHTFSDDFLITILGLVRLSFSLVIIWVSTEGLNMVVFLIGAHAQPVTMKMCATRDNDRVQLNCRHPISITNIQYLFSVFVLAVAIGKSQQLKKEKLRWRSQAAMTTEQLAEKRKIFWETAPAYEGKKEVWDALSAAATAAEGNSPRFMIASSIEGSNYKYYSCVWSIVMFVMSCSGWLGPRPSNYRRRRCFNAFRNFVRLLRWTGDTVSGSAVLSFDTVELDSWRGECGERCGQNRSSQTGWECFLPGMCCKVDHTSIVGKDMNVKLRFSDGDKDIKFPINTEETVGTMKKRVFQDVRNIDVADQRCVVLNLELTYLSRTCIPGCDVGIEGYCM